MSSFFDPIYTGAAHPQENWAFLRGTTQFFDFGQRTYTILQCQDSKVELREIYEKPSWISIALRVAALCTLIIPLIMCVGVLIYRALNIFKVVVLQNPLDQLPKEILTAIYQQTGQDCLQLRATSKANLELIESESTLKSYRIIPTLEKCCNLAEKIVDQSNKFDALAILAKTIPYLSPKEARDLAMKMQAVACTPSFSEYKSETLTLIAMGLSAKDPKAALKLMDESAKEASRLLESKKWRDLSTIILNLGKLNPGKALEVSEQMIREANTLNKEYVLKYVAKALAASFPLKAVEIASTLKYDYDKSQALVDISKIFIGLGGEKAREATEEALKVASAMADDRDPGDNKARALRALVEVLALFAPHKAWEVANTIRHPDLKSSALTCVAMAFATLEPKRALAIVKTIKDTYYRFQILKAVAKTLSLLDPEKAIKVAKKVNEDNRSRAFAAIAKTLAPIDSEKAMNCIDLGLASLNSIDDHDRYGRGETFSDSSYKADAISALAEPLAFICPKRADELIREAKSIRDQSNQLWTLTEIAKAIIPFDKEKGIETLDLCISLVKTIKYSKRIGDINYKARDLAIIAETLALLDPQKAVEIADTISMRYYKTDVAKILAPLDLQKAVALIDTGDARNLSKVVLAFLKSKM